MLLGSPELVSDIGSMLYDVSKAMKEFDNTQTPTMSHIRSRLQTKQLGQVQITLSPPLPQ